MSNARHCLLILFVLSVLTTAGAANAVEPAWQLLHRDGRAASMVDQLPDGTIHAIDPDHLPAYEDQSIQQYLGKTGTPASSFMKTESGIYYHIAEMGSGTQITPEARLKVGYTLKTLNGTIIEQSPTDSTTMNLGSTISGWK